MNYEHHVDSTPNYSDYCTDVLVTVEEEEHLGKVNLVKYVASFFSYLHIESLTITHKGSGDFNNGQYFYSKNMLLINNCEPSNIYKAVHHLVEEGNFLEVFRRITEPISET